MTKAEMDKTLDESPPNAGEVNNELGRFAGKDPVQFRLQLLISGPPAGTQGVMNAERMIDVVKLVAENPVGAKKKFPPGRALGIGFHFSLQGYFAENAVFTATGERIRTMPMTKQGFSFA